MPVQRCTAMTTLSSRWEPMASASLHALRVLAEWWISRSSLLLFTLNVGTNPTTCPTSSTASTTQLQRTASRWHGSDALDRKLLFTLNVGTNPTTCPTSSTASTTQLQRTASRWHGSDALDRKQQKVGSIRGYTRSASRGAGSNVVESRDAAPPRPCIH